MAFSDARYYPPLFLRLPPEIRLQIYRYLLHSPEPLKMQPRAKASGQLSSAIIRTCRLLYNEAIAVLYGENSFALLHIEMSNPNVDLITRAAIQVLVPTEHASVEKNARMLARHLEACPAIKELQITTRLVLDHHLARAHAYLVVLTMELSRMGHKLDLDLRIIYIRHRDICYAVFRLATRRICDDSPWCSSFDPAHDGVLTQEETLLW